MKKKKFFSFFLLLCLLAALLPPLPAAAAAQAPTLYSSSAILLDRQTGRVIYAKNEDAKLYPASLTKIMTVLLAVEAVESGQVALTDQVTASRNITYDLSALGSTAGIQVGETMPLEDLIYCAMLSSANEACNIIGEHVGGTISGFIDRMNAKAEELGCVNTHFANTHGLTDANHYTTPADMSIIALAASRHTLFMQFCGTADYVVPATNLSGQRYLHNSNAFLSSQGTYGAGYLYQYASGMKTGHTSFAGYCLASTAEKDGLELLCLTFGSQTSDGCFLDGRRLLDWAFANYVPEEMPAEEYLVGATQSLAESGPSPTDTEGPDIDSAAAVVLNQETGEVFYSRHGESRIYPADTVKLMTALLAVDAIENGQVSLRSETTVSAGVGFDLTSTATRLLTEGETITLESLLYLVLLPSADDACNAVAEQVAGSIPLFIEQMNLRAERLGCTGTHFSNTHGLFDPNTYSTAGDMALIALEASRHDTLVRLCSTLSVELPETNVSSTRTVTNTNALLGAGSVYGGNYVYERATGLKTGYNSASGYCLLSSAKDPDTGISLVAAVFGGVRGEGFSSFSDTITLFDHIFENYSYQEVLSPNVSIASVDVNLGKDSKSVNLRPASSVTLLLPNGYDPDNFYPFLETAVVYSIEQGKIVTAPVTAGEVLGEVSVIRRSDGKNFGTVKLVAASSVELSRMQYIRSHVEETIHTRSFRLAVLGLALLLALYLVWVILYRVKRIRYLRALKAQERLQAAEDPVVPTEAVPSVPVYASPEIQHFVHEEEPEAETEPAPELPSPASAAPAPTSEHVQYAPSQEPIPDTPAPAEEYRKYFSPAPEEIPPEVPAEDPLPAPAEEAPAPAAPAEEPAPSMSDPFADIDLKLFDSKAERDYFEEFFRKK